MMAGIVRTMMESVSEVFDVVRSYQTHGYCYASGSHVEKCGLLGCVAEACDEGGAVSRDDTAATTFEQHDEPLGP